MNIARFSIKRPILISSAMILLVVLGIISLKGIGVNMFPSIEIPVIAIVTTYKGASPEEIESLVSKPIEENVSSVSGMKHLTSYNRENTSIIVAEFTLESDFASAEQQVRDKVAMIRGQLPTDIDEPIFYRFDPADTPIVRLSLQADLPPTELYDLAKEEVKTQLQQVDNVGSVKIMGGTKREIQIELDRNKLNYNTIPALSVANALLSGGVNVPVGKHENAFSETVFRAIGQFENVNQIENAVVSFSGDVDNSITVKKLGVVHDGSADPDTYAFLYYPEDGNLTQNRGFFARHFGKKQKIAQRTERPALFFDVYKQSGSNTVAVADGVIKKIEKINKLLEGRQGSPRVFLVYDNAKAIRSNIAEVKNSIVIGVLLAVLVVYLFLGNVRSTIITGIAIPNSLLGAFIIMYVMGFTANMMTLLALSLTVGLLVDDAIVVRENIFRKLETGMHPFKAAEVGTMQVALAVIATTLTVISVFFPIGFLQGMIGRFFKEFGFTVVFAMIISYVDSMTVAPFLSGYFAGKPGKANNRVVQSFDRFQIWLEKWYGKAMRYSLRKPGMIVLIAVVIFIVSLGAFSRIKKTFMPTTDFGQIQVSFELPSRTSLDGTRDFILKVEEEFKKLPDIDYMATTMGTDMGETNKATISVFMVPYKERSMNTSAMKDKLRELLNKYPDSRAAVGDFSMGLGGGQKAFTLNVVGEDLDLLTAQAEKVMAVLKKVPDLTEVTMSYQPGKPEFQFQLDPQKMQRLGVMPKTAGAELRYQVAGGVVGKLHQHGLEYDIRLRLNPSQRDLRAAYNETRVPNIQNRMIPISALGNAREAVGPSQIIRQDRSRVIQITANLIPGGAIGDATTLTKKLLSKEAVPPKGIRYAYQGQSEDFADLVKNIMIAFGLSFIFIYLVLSSLYESFITPFTILVAIPPALSGAFFGLFLTGKMFDMFSMIGIIMLLGIVAKNSILLVDFALVGLRSGLDRKEAIYQAGMTRLRPILMTTFAMLAGTLPTALGFGEAGSFRSSMGIAVIGGLILSTFVTLLLVPAIFEYIDRFREFCEKPFRQIPEPALAEGERIQSGEEMLMEDIRRACGQDKQEPCDEPVVSSKKTVKSSKPKKK